MRIYNSLTRNKEELTAPNRSIRLYVCGITPYDTTHMGHAFTYAVFDVLVRYLEFKGYTVRYVQNVTDVDDDILRRAEKLGIAWHDLAREQTAHYLEDMASLNVRRPDVMPRASEEIPKILDIVDVLLARGYAYRSGGNVYFEVSKDTEFGKLSLLSRQQMVVLARERGGYPDDPRKKHPLDFVLWQESGPGEPRWDSPWGEGRPGWHVECSAMSLRYLGEMLDIHGGGQDLVFPHHECEIAQSEHYTGLRPFSRFWMHTGMVRLAGEKMSKSTGNLVLVGDVLARYSGDAVRLYLESFYYRESWDYEEDRLEQAEFLVAYVRDALEGWSGNGIEPWAKLNVSDRFFAAMEDDLNIPRAIEAMRYLAREVTTLKRQGRDVQSLQTKLVQMVDILGLSIVK